MVLTDRDRRLLSAVAEFGILTRAQILRQLRFGSVTRVNAVLLRLTRHGYLTRRVQPTVFGRRRQTYVLGPSGIELLEKPTHLMAARARRGWLQCSDLFVEHRLSVNDVRLAFTHATAAGYVLNQWLAEAELRRLSLGLIPDAYVEYRLNEKSFAAFFEVDNGTEGRARWQAKVAAYLDLGFSGRFQQVFGRQYFRVLVTVPSEARLRNIAQEVSRRTDRIFWLALLSDVWERGPFAAIWRRPDGTTHQSLIQP